MRNCERTPPDEFDLEDPRPSPWGKARRTAVEVLYADGAIVVVNKPSGVPVESTDEETASATGQLLAAGVLRPDEPGWAVYPLESDGSGLQLLARSPQIAEALLAQIDQQQLELRYCALVRGRPGQQDGVVDLRLSPGGTGGGITRIDASQGQPAVTRWRVLDSFIGYAVLECVPATTLPCQIRAHLNAIGLPLVVDPAYGGGTQLMLSSFTAGYTPSRRRAERPLIQRLSLHVSSVAFAHPGTGQPMRFEAPMPKDLRAAIHQLDRFGRIPR